MKNIVAFMIYKKWKKAINQTPIVQASLECLNIHKISIRDNHIRLVLILQNLRLGIKLLSSKTKECSIGIHYLILDLKSHTQIPHSKK